MPRLRCNHRAAGGFECPQREFTIALAVRNANAFNALGVILSVMGLILGYYGISERNEKEVWCNSR